MPAIRLGVPCCETWLCLVGPGDWVVLCAMRVVSWQEII